MGMRLTDDLDPRIADTEATPVTNYELAVNGVLYSIDLGTENTAKLSKALQPYLDVARLLGTVGPLADQAKQQRSTGKQAAGGSAAPSDGKLAKAWGAATNWTLPDGTVPKSARPGHPGKAHADLLADWIKAGRPNVLDGSGSTSKAPEPASGGTTVTPAVA